MPLKAEDDVYRNIAARFCEVVEASHETPSAGLITIRKTLIELYTAFSNMPDVADDTFQQLPERLAYEDYRRIKDKVSTVFPNDFFWICYHPFRSPAEQPVCASISDGLADIWRDLKRGLLALDEDTDHWATAVFWDWKFSFDSHWGHHAVDSIWAIHKLLRDFPPEDE